MEDKQNYSEQFPKGIDNRKTGKRYEAVVANYLAEKQYEIVAVNYQSGRYEIDLVAIDKREKKEVLVFIEVKFRSNKNDPNYFKLFNPFASIPPSKQKKIIGAAKQFLAKHPQYENSYSRFDAVIVLEERNQKNNSSNNISKIFQIEDAFRIE